jgi:hypothetical protein
LNDSQRIFGYSPKVAEAVLTYFVRVGLIVNPIASNEGYNEYELNVEAFDFANHGGFTNQEVLLEHSIKKLLLEIEKLKPDHSDKVKNITELASSILSGLDIMHKWNS